MEYSHDVYKISKPIRTSINLGVPEVNPPRIQPTADIDKADIRVGFLPQWFINQMLNNPGVSTSPDRMKARYTFEPMFVALMVTP